METNQLIRVEGIEGGSQPLSLNMSRWSTAIQRLPEVKMLVPAVYSDLEFAFQEAWRESRTNAIMVEDAIKKTERLIEQIKADIILDEIPKMIEEKKLSKTANNADFRAAVIAKNNQHREASEHLNKLQALLSHFESHMKIMENTSRFIKKQMDYHIRSGTISSGVYQR